MKRREETLDVDLPEWMGDGGRKNKGEKKSEKERERVWKKIRRKNTQKMSQTGGVRNEKGQ